MCKEGDQDRKKKAIVSNIYITGWNGERYENYMYKQNFDLCVYEITKILILSNMRYHIMRMKVFFNTNTVYIIYVYHNQQLWFFYSWIGHNQPLWLIGHNQSTKV